jgi:Domain of unknown function (DUF4124)
MLRSAAMLRPIVLTAFIAAGLCSVAQADVYRWVDDKGQPHYSDRWVPGSELISSSRPHAPSTNGSSASDPNKAIASANQSTDAKASAQKNAEAAKADAAKLREQQCKEAKDRYQKAIESRRIYKEPKPGDTDRTFMSDAETDAYRAQARADVTDTCGRPPAAVTTPEASSPSEKPEQ